MPKSPEHSQSNKEHIRLAAQQLTPAIVDVMRVTPVPQGFEDSLVLINNNILKQQKPILEQLPTQVANRFISLTKVITTTRSIIENSEQDPDLDRDQNQIRKDDYTQLFNEGKESQQGIDPYAQLLLAHIFVKNYTHLATILKTKFPSHHLLKEISHKKIEQDMKNIDKKQVTVTTILEKVFQDP
jgi:hypothetical protein